MKNNYRRITLKRLIALCWVLLGVCFVINIFCSGFFEILCENERFIAFCNYLDNNIFGQYIICLISSIITVSLFLLAILQQARFTKRQASIVITIIILGVIIKLASSILCLAVDILQLIILPFILKPKWKGYWYRVLIGNIFNIVFQIISLYAKSIELRIIVNESMLITIIYCIDMYIMLTLYYLYENLKKEKSMGAMFSWFLSNDLSVLNNRKEELQNLIINEKDKDISKGYFVEYAELIKKIDSLEITEENETI